MADKTIEYESVGIEEAADKMRDAAKASDEVTDSLKDSEKQSGKSEESTGKLTAALGKAALAYAALKLVVVDGIKQHAQEEAALGRLERSYSRNNTTVGAYSKALSQARTNSVELGVSYSEQVDGLSQLVDASGDAAIAQQDLNLAINIAAAEGRELSDTVEILRKARNGEVTELVNLNGVNKDLADSLAKIENQSERTAKAIGVLSKEYEGAAEETKGTEERLAAWTETGKLALGVVGQLATGFIDLAGVGLTTVSEKTIGADVSLQNLNTTLVNLSAFLDEANLVDAFALATATGDDKRKLVDAILAKSAARQAGAGRGAPAPVLTGQQVQEVPSDQAIAEARFAEELAAEEKRQRRLVKGKAAAKKAAEAAEAFGAGFVGEFTEGAAGETLESAAGKEGQAEQERLDRLATFKNNEVLLEREAAEEIKRIKQDQIDFSNKVADNDELNAQARSDDRAALVGEAQAGVQAASDIAAAFVKGEGEQAALKALVEGGLALASLALLPPDFRGAALHAASAAQLTAAAAAAGVGGKAKSKGSFGGGGAGAAGRSSSTRGAAPGGGDSRSDSILLGEAGRNAGRGTDRGLVVNFNSTFPAGPQTRRSLRQAQTLDMDTDA